MIRANRRGRLALWAVVGLLLLAFAIRTYRLDAQELGFDAVASVFVASHGPLGLFAYVRGAIREHPPLYYFLLSLWMPVVGRSEFAIRFLSVGIGVITIVTMYRLVRRTAGLSVALFAAVLLTLSPFHVHESRNPRMYGLLALFSLLSLFFFVRLLNEDRGRWWVLFWLVTGLGAFTHYYMAFVLLAEDIFLLLTCRRYRRLMLRWVLTHLALGGAAALWIAFSPGLWTTIVSFWDRGVASGVRWSGAARALNGLFLGTTTRPNWPHLAIPLLLTLVGIGVAQWRKPWLPREHRDGGLLLGLLVSVPFVIVLALPERVTGRYLTTVLPPVVLAMAISLSWLSSCRPRLSFVRQFAFHAVWIALCLWIVYLSFNSYPLAYEAKDLFRSRMEYIKAHAQPDDGLLLHGPWQFLMLTYYDPGLIARYEIPRDGPRVEAESAAAKLAQMFVQHDCVWVSYDSVPPVDPDGIVAQWLHENTYRMHAEGDLVLYCAAPEEELPPGSVGVQFGGRVQLERLVVVDAERTDEAAVLIHTEWRVLQHIKHSLVLRLELIDSDGSVWAVHESHLGPHHVYVEDRHTGETFVERLGLVVPVGTPPGDYALRLRVFSDGVEWMVEGDEPFQVEGAVQVPHSEPPWRIVQALPGRNVRAVFGDRMAIIAHEPGGDKFTHGYPMSFSVYWRALDSLPEEYELDIRLVANDGSVLVMQSTELVPGFSTTRWLEGDVLLGRHTVMLPADAPAGHYQVSLAVRASDGTTLPVKQRRISRLLGTWPREEVLFGTEATLFSVEIEERPRLFRPPRMQHRVDAVFGEDMRLLGYDLDSSAVQRGDTLDLTTYWQALRPMDSVYAMFNHLAGPDGSTVAQLDSWPQGGMYPTVQWWSGEVVEERYAIPVPLDAVPGQYELRVGIYNASNGERPVTLVDGVSVPERYVVLATISVEE